MLYYSNVKFIPVEQQQQFHASQDLQNLKSAFAAPPADYLPELGNTNPIAIKKFTAESSASVNYSKGDITAALKNVKNDFRENVDKALEQAVKSITSVEGNIPSLPASFPQP